MDSALLLSAATALACTPQASGQAYQPHVSSTAAGVYGRALRVNPPVIELSAYPLILDQALEQVINSSMSIDFERRYTL